MPSVAPFCRSFADRVEAAAPSLTTEIRLLTDSWLKPLANRLAHDENLSGGQKIFNDPVWGSIMLQPAETLLLDTPLLQRLRGVRQLGMAHYVYPGAGYCRLEHICGVVEGTQRIVLALDASAQAPALPSPVPQRAPTDLQALRLAALLHDVGHGPFSHATEHFIQSRFAAEFEALRDAILNEFDDVLKVSPAEMLSLLIILSEPMLGILMHSRFPVAERDKLPMIMAGAIIGSARYLSASYLGAIVSGPIDADKLDYMVRDSHHAGLAIGLETTRLLTQLHVAVLTEENAPNAILRERARAKKNIYELGISRAGIGAYEQMIVGRAILYDRVYYHHKVRTVEAMVRRLIEFAEADQGSPFDLSQLMPSLSDDTFVCCLGGIVKADEYPAPSNRTQKMAAAIVNRDLYKRAFAFGTRFLEGVELTDEQTTADVQSLIGREFYKFAHNRTEIKSIERQIADCARRIGSELRGKYLASQDATEDDIILDLPSPDRIAVRGQDILVRTGAGDIELPNLYFDPEKWSRAYQVKKMCGFVFAPEAYVRSVNLAAKLIFAERFNAVMAPGADRLSKTSNIHEKGTIDRLLRAGLVTIDVANRIGVQQPHFLRIFPDELGFPTHWKHGSDIASSIALKLREARPLGFTATEHQAVCGLIQRLSSFYDVAYQTGLLKDVDIGEEARLQQAILSHIRSAGDEADEAPRLSGGISDILFRRYLIIENKILPNATDTPLTEGGNAPWQARRYSIPYASQIVAVVVGYKPKTELGHVPGRDAIEVRQLSDGRTVEIRLAVPVAYTSPSAAKAPPQS
jgi:HD superfamily phosphohydrolase